MVLPAMKRTTQSAVLITCSIQKSKIFFGEVKMEHLVYFEFFRKRSYLRCLESLRFKKSLSMNSRFATTLRLVISITKWNLHLAVANVISSLVCTPQNH